MQKFFLFIFTLWVSFCGAEEPIAVYLTWKQDPTTTMTIQWITSKEELSDTLQYRVRDGALWQTQNGLHKEMPQEEPYLIHVAEITGLEPNSSYYFRVGPEGNEY